MFTKVLILKAIDMLLELLTPAVESTENELDDSVLDAAKQIKDAVDKVL